MQNFEQGQDNQQKDISEYKTKDTGQVSVDNVKPMEDKKENSNKKYLLIIAISLILIFFVLIGYLVYFVFLKDDDKGNGKTETSETSSQISTSSSSLSTSTSIVSTATSTSVPDPYDGWLTYANDLLGYTMKYPPSYTLDDSNEHCVYFRKGVVSLNIGRGYMEDDFGCFRTGVGAYEIEYTPKNYSVDGNDYAIEEWYEKHECTDSGYGNIYGRLMLGKILFEESEVDFGLEYSGCPRDTFNTERGTINKIIESVVWGK